MASADAVLAEIVRRSLAFDVTVILAPGATVDSDGVACGGYFDDDTKTIAVATGRQPSTWMGTLLHEYCHLTQWVESIPAWRAYDETMWHWLKGKRHDNPKAAMKSVLALEDDCERRTVRLARELDAPINLDRYVRAANAYLHFHSVMLAKRKWFRTGVVLEELPALLALCNPTFDTVFSKTPTALRVELEKLI